MSLHVMHLEVVDSIATAYKLVFHFSILKNKWKKYSKLHKWDLNRSLMPSRRVQQLFGHYEFSVSFFLCFILLFSRKSKNRPAFPSKIFISVRLLIVENFPTRPEIPIEHP